VSVPDPLAFLVLDAVVLAAAVAVAARAHGTGEHGLVAVAGWALLCAVSNVLPVPAVRNVYLSMSSPVNVAVAALFPPGTAALLVAVASVSEWELRGETTVTHAAFNRAQLALSTAAAGAVFAVAGHATPAGAVLAVVGYQAVNWGLVAAAEASCRAVSFGRVLRGLVPRRPVAAASYFVLGLMGVALAQTYDRVGAWAVALLLLPLLGGRQAVAALGELERSERAQRALTHRLIDERERERVRIAAEIHDVVLQELAALQLAAANVRTAVATGRPDLAAHLSAVVEHGARRAVTSLRGSIASLRRATLDEAGLGPTLARYVRSFSAQSGVDVEVEANAGDLPLPVAMLLYECCLESLTNVTRHAQATRCRVVVRREGSAAELVVADDGIGVSSPAGTGLGLLREKVELAGGRLAVRRRRDGGTEVTARIPVGPVG
jgi:signal transduction histidine kinase